jgi:hypothetical protein
MALTIEINHAKTRANAAAAGSGQPVMPQAVKGRIRRIRRSCSISSMDGCTSFSPRYGRRPFLVTGLIVLASSILILANALAGRLCGFACSQTVWSDLFLLVERLIEGNRRQFLKNLGAPLDAKRVMQIVAKHSARLLISFATSGTLILLHRCAGTAAQLSR